MPILTSPNHNRGSALKRTCPYCDVVFTLAILLAMGAMMLSMLQSVYVIWALWVFIFTLANCFCQSRTKRLGLIFAGLLECSYGLFSVIDLLNMKNECDNDDGDTRMIHRYVPCNLLFLGITAGLWIASGSLIFYFVFSGRVKEYIKEGLEIEAVATPLGSVEEPLDDLELGHNDDDQSDGVSFSGSDNDDEDRSYYSEEEEEGDQSDQDDSTTDEPATVAVSATICEIPDYEMEGMSEERRAKLALSVPITPARPLEDSERSNVSYLPTGARDWDATS